MFVLRFHRNLSLAFLAIAAIGWLAVYFWAVPVYTQHKPLPHLAFPVILLAPIGTGFFFMTLQRIYVDEDRIESRFLGLRKRLDIKTTAVQQVNTANYVIRDGNGRRLGVSKAAAEQIAWICQRRFRSNRTIRPTQTSRISRRSKPHPF